MRRYFCLSLQVVALLALSFGLVSCTKGQISESSPKDTAERRYVGKNVKECSTIRFVCQPGETYFSDDKGCGCEVGPEPVANEPAVDEPAPVDVAANGAVPAGDPVVCSDESRKADVCAEVVEEVCGLFDPKKIQCIMAPCGATYNNGCLACMNSDVVAYTPGKCN